MQLLARAHVELREQTRALCELVGESPDDPLRRALTKVGLIDADYARDAHLRIVRSVDEIAALTEDELRGIYCRVTRASSGLFQHEILVVRHWDGMDGCWTDVTGEVSRAEALHFWAGATDGGVRQISYDEIDYYRIFPSGTRMHWDGSAGQEMHR